MSSAGTPYHGVDRCRVHLMDDAELTLAAAVAAGDPAAIREFEARYLVPVRSQLRAMNLSAADIADIEQTIRIKLLVGEEGAPARLVQYAGQGKLGGLVASPRFAKR